MSSYKGENENKREVRSFLMARDPSVDRRFRPRPNKKIRLFGDIRENEECCSDLSDEPESEYTTGDEENSVPTNTDISEVETGPLIYLRLRPVEKRTSTYKINDNGTVLITGSSSAENSTSTNKTNMEKHYSFTSIFDSEVGQRDVFKKCIGNKIQSEESFTILAYGTSGSGKTFTLLGDEVRAGIIPRALENIFTLYAANIYPEPSMKLVNARLEFLTDDAVLNETQIYRRTLAACPDITLHHKRLQQIFGEDHKFETNQQDGVSVIIWISFAEIYNELVYDLLDIPKQSLTGNMVEPPRKSLKIVCNNGKVFIKGLSSIHAKSSNDALKLLRFGLQRLTYAATAINANSSRSHCIFFVDILKFHCSGETTQTSYKFCDLAGSERLDKTGNIGSRLKEAQRINTSLMVLGRCLDAASNSRKKNNNDVIPFRESKLTMLLQEPLLGKEKLAMIVTITPLDKYYEENFNVLGFAAIAKNIVFKQLPVKQYHSRYSTLLNYSQQTTIDECNRNREYIVQIENENILLRAENQRLKSERFMELQELEEKLRKELTDSFKETLQMNLDQCEQSKQKALYIQKREFEAEMATMKRKYEETIEDLRDELEEQKNQNQNSEIELSD